MMLNDKVFDRFPWSALREIQPSHTPAIFEMRCNALVNQFFTRAPMKTLGQAQGICLKARNAFPN